MFFRKSLFQCLAWLLVSELMCLVIAFSFALLPSEGWRWVSMICGILAHCLLMLHAGKEAANRYLIEVRTGGNPPKKITPFLLALLTALVLWIFYAVLWVKADSKSYLNVFLLLNAPFIQLHRLILNGAEPFSALESKRQILMGLPPIATVLSVLIGYTISWLPGIEEIRARQAQTASRPTHW